MIVGQKEEMARGILASTLVGLAAQYPPATSNEVRVGARFAVLDGTPEDHPETDQFARLAKLLPHPIAVGGWRELPAILAEIAAEVDRRQQPGAADGPEIFVFIHDLPRFRDLRRKPDDFGFSGRVEDAGPPDHLAAILRDGPGLGVHLLVWCDNLNNVNRYFDHQGLRELGMRVLFQMSQTDSGHLLDSPHASKLGPHRASTRARKPTRSKNSAPTAFPTTPGSPTFATASPFGPRRRRIDDPSDRRRWQSDHAGRGTPAHRVDRRDVETAGGIGMSENVIQLPKTTRLGRRVLGDCRWKIKTFVERDAYVEYDYGGGIVQSSLDVITETHVHAMNCAMRARSSNAAWSRFLGQPLSELREILETLDLVDGADAEVRAGFDALTRLARRLLSRPGLTDVSVSKVLHLLRPRFVAISDSYVRRCLGIDETGTGSTTDRVDTLMAVQRGIRLLAKSNEEALNKLTAYAGSLANLRPKAGKFSGQDIPVRLSKARILDIILWTDVAIHDENHQLWSGWYDEEVSQTESG